MVVLINPIISGYNRYNSTFSPINHRLKMNEDLQKLEINQGEIRHIIGMDPREVSRPIKIAKAQDVWNFLLQEMVIAVALTPLIIGFLYTFIILPAIGPSVPIAIACVGLTPLMIILGRWFWQKRTKLTALVTLLEDVDRYNSVIRAIQISDQIEAAGNQDATISDRQTAIAALQFTRQDLLRALKTERILRENQEFIGTNPELFASNLTAVKALELNDRASEYGQFLDRALQIGVSIQTEMRRLQNQR